MVPSTQGWPGIILQRGCPPYPGNVQRYLGEHAPQKIQATGNVGILRGETLALFCSIKCPGDLILKTYDEARHLRDEGVTVIGGFHSPMEKECLALLLRGQQPVVVCLSRSVSGARIPTNWRGPLMAGRLLLLSPFAGEKQRVTTERAERRNRFIAALADRILVAYAEPNGKTERLCRDFLALASRL